jgi:hypothetical protein
VSVPKLACPCGEVIDLSQIPVPGEHVLISGDDWDQLVDALAVAATHAGTGDAVLLKEALSDALAGFGDDVYRCPRCGRLVLVHRDTGAAEFFTVEPPAE